MRPLIIMISISTALIFGCSKQPKTESPVNFSSESDSASQKIKKADSTYTVRHGTFDGLHSHGKNAAVHSHQDIPKMRRMEAFNAKRNKIREESYKRTAEFQDSIRKARLKETDSLN